MFEAQLENLQGKLRHHVISSEAGQTVGWRLPLKLDYCGLATRRLRINPPGRGPGAPHAGRNYPTTSIFMARGTIFTPYEVLNLDHAAPYSKNLYYDLVKIYHPARPCIEHRLCRGLSPEVRLKRYHIVVAAHELLSDPNKRAAYDQFGAGWKYGPKQYNTTAEASAEWDFYFNPRNV
ncbi:hypothetical protein N7481_001507 [Penicillium waksmanii]|uniref:uncharacterized protein n=1 Tax=Penicillium waksmanii TaxID=69791 RepID=UPI002547D93A|nr:uncharacterized protein N7481_001507 [Penicillium waksmanii]KAJ6001098.1 hypothetical protein N7481_001507 [Penicillium waksmanii]